MRRLNVPVLQCLPYESAADGNGAYTSLSAR